MPPAAHRTRRRAVVHCLFVALTAVMCAALLTAAALVPAPPVVLPLLVIVGIGCPMAAACELPRALAGLRRPAPPRAVDSGAVAALRRQLDALPETQHPLGL